MLRWWNGIHGGLKILCSYELAGSNPALSTKETDSQKWVCFFVYCGYGIQTSQVRKRSEIARYDRHPALSTNKNSS